MLDHVSLGVTDLERSKAFYDAVLKPLGVSRFYDYEGGLGYGTAADKIQFWIGGPFDAGRHEFTLTGPLTGVRPGDYTAVATLVGRPAPPPVRLPVHVG